MTRILLLLAVLLFPIVTLTYAQEDAEGVYIATKPDRSVEQIDSIYKRMVPVKFTPSRNRWKHLPRVAHLLATQGSTIRILALGDSIINDTCHSGWDNLLRRDYPGRDITLITCVRGSTGCWWYKTPERMEKYVYSQKPDLLILGGISHNNDIDSIREVVTRARERLGCDVLLISPVFGTVDPKDDKQWQEKLDTDGTDFRSRLYRLSDELHVAFLDMTAPWGKYIRDSGEDTVSFKRDTHHANERGEQISGRILETYLSPSNGGPM